MTKNSHKTLHGLIILFLLLIVLALLLGVQRSDTLQSSLASGRFEAHYTSTMDTLKKQTRAVQDKLRANMPDGVELLPENMLHRVKAPDPKTEAEEETNPTLGDIRLRGIYWSDSMPLAEINSRLCKPGDEIAGCTLEEIQPYQIILKDWEGNRHTNSLVKDIVTTEPKRSAKLSTTVK